VIKHSFVTRRKIGTGHGTAIGIEFQLACPVCSAFNPADFRFCPRCGHRLGAPDMVQSLSATPSPRTSLPSTPHHHSSAAGGCHGLDGALWPRVSLWVWRWWPAESRVPTSDIRLSQSDGEKGALSLLTPPFEGDDRPGATPPPSGVAGTDDSPTTRNSRGGVDACRSRRIVCAKFVVS
jgi:hypothetical protein